MSNTRHSRCYKSIKQFFEHGDNIGLETNFILEKIEDHPPIVEKAYQFYGFFSCYDLLGHCFYHPPIVEKAYQFYGFFSVTLFTLTIYYSRSFLYCFIKTYLCN